MVWLDRESNRRSSISNESNRGVRTPPPLTIDATSRNSSRSFRYGCRIGSGSPSCTRPPCRDGPGSLSRSPAHRRYRSGQHERNGTSATIRAAFPLDTGRRRPALAGAETVPSKRARTDREALRLVRTRAVEQPALESRRPDSPRAEKYRSRRPSADRDLAHLSRIGSLPIAPGLSQSGTHFPRPNSRFARTRDASNCAVRPVSVPSSCSCRRAAAS